MKNGRLILLWLLWVTPVVAQPDMEQLFQKDNPNIIYQNEPHQYQGAPLVYLEGTSDKPRPKTWEDKLKIKLFGSMEIPKTSGPELDTTPSVSVENGNQDKVEIKPTFGPKKEVAFIPHTPDWHFVITATDHNVFSVHEELSFILKEDKEILTRDWPIKPKDFKLIQAKLDGQIFPYQLEENDYTALNLSSIPTGSHKMQLDYLIIPPTQQNTVVIPLIGHKWPFMADTFSGVILTNTNQFTLPEFLIGTNNQSFPENFTTSKDAQGNIFFKMNKILPAGTQIQLKTNSDMPVCENIFNQSFSNIFLIVMISILSLYILLSALEIKYMSLEKKLKKFPYQIHHRFISFISRNKEVIIGCFLLILLGLALAFIYHINLSYSIPIILITLVFFLIVITDYLIVHPVQREIFIMHQIQQERKS